MLKYLGVGLLVYLLLFGREQEPELIDEFLLLQRGDLRRLKIRSLNNELYAYAEELFVRAKIKNLDDFMKKLENLKLLSVEFDYESLEASKGSNIGPLLNMAILALVGYWIFLSYKFYKK